jgi:hypothetical protein
LSLWTCKRCGRSINNAIRLMKLYWNWRFCGSQPPWLNTTITATRLDQASWSRNIHPESFSKPRPPNVLFGEFRHSIALTNSSKVSPACPRWLVSPSVVPLLVELYTMCAPNSTYTSRGRRTRQNGSSCKPSSWDGHDHCYSCRTLATTSSTSTSRTVASARRSQRREATKHRDQAIVSRLLATDTNEDLL